LAKPFIVAGCNQSDPSQASFVQGGIVRRKHGRGGSFATRLRIYNPLVANEGQSTVPQDAPDLGGGEGVAVVALWFGTNADGIVLKNKQGRGNGACVDGFGQFAYCNAPKFFEAAKEVVPPPLGTAKDGLPCPTTRDFSVVDQDPSDNVATVYLVDPTTGAIMADTPDNRKAHPNAVELVNGSDEHLLAVNIAQALGCSPFLVPDVLSGESRPSLFANELSANALQGPPVALVPELDPMVLVDGQPNREKLNSFRAGVLQPPNELADTTRYCNELANATARLQLDKPFTSVAASPNPEDANSLFTFLAFRLVGTWGDLTCEQLTGNPVPVTLVTDNAGVVVDATYGHANTTTTTPAPGTTNAPTNAPGPSKPTPCPTQKVTAAPTLPTATPPTPSAPTPTGNPAGYKFTQLTLGTCWGAVGQATTLLNGNISPMPTAELGLSTVKITFSSAVTLQNSWNVDNPQTSGNVLSFVLQDDQPNVGGIVQFPGLNCVNGAITSAGGVALTFSAQIG
jgi:hypothetical protein